MSTAKKLFKRATLFLDLIDDIVAVTSKHKYTFVSDEWFKQWQQSDEFPTERANYIIALELIEKAHLASIRIRLNIIPHSGIFDSCGRWQQGSWMHLPE
jgi:hypothetical protein